MDIMDNCFMKLPAELRNQVYHYLLSPEYTRVEQKKCQSMDIDTLSRSELTRSHRYRFHTQILRTNKDISREASCVFDQQNLFVTFRCSYPGFLIEKIENNLLPILAKDHTASRFAHHTTVITLSPWCHPESRPVPVIFTILGENLPAFVTMLLVYERTLSGLLKNSALTISINERLGGGSGAQESGDEEALPVRSATRRLLEPLCGLDSIQAVRIIGPVSDQYMAHIKASITRRRPTAEQTITALCSAVDDANQTSRSGEYALAMIKYKAVTRDLWRFDIMKPEMTNTIVHAGEYAGLSLEVVRGSACFRIASGLADMYLRLGNFKEAHQWAFAALEPFKNSRIRFAIRLGDVSLTSVFLIAAKASEGCGLLLQARDELERGWRFDPGNQLILSELRRLRDLIIA